MTSDDAAPTTTAASAETTWVYLVLPDRFPVPDGMVIPIEGHPDWDLAALSEHLAHTQVSLRFHHVHLPHPHGQLVDPLLEWAASLDPEEDSSPSSTETLGQPLKQFETSFVEAAVLHRSYPGFEIDSVEKAVEVAISAVRSLQRAVGLTEQKPFRLISKGTLPPFLPIRSGHIKSEGMEGDLGIIVTSPSAHLPQLHPLVTNEEALATIEAALNATDAPSLSAVLDLKREAQVQLHWDHNYRLAAMTTGIAGEVFLDAVLLRLLWEESCDPAKAAEPFGPTGMKFAKRVHSHLPHRLGGNWNDGPVNDFFRNAVQLRHRVAHRGYEPTEAEAQQAYDSFEGLMRWVGRRLATPSAVKRYPRAAVAFVGTEQLRKLGRMTRALEKLVSDPAEPNWNATFERWRYFVDRHVDPDAPAPGSDPSGLRLYLDVPLEGGPRFVVVDHWTSHATLVTAEEAGEWVDPSRVAEVSDVAVEEEPPIRIWMAVDAIPLGPEREWVPTYTLLGDESITVSD